MERLYVGLRVLGQRDRVRTEIVRAIQTLRVGLRIPVLKLERPKSRRGGAREFYVFLGTDEDQGADLRSVAEEVFRHARLTGQPLWGIREQELRSSFVGEVDVTVVGGLRDIYEPRWRQVGDSSDLGESLPVSGNLQGESLAFDRLLAWMSARGEGPWPTFIQAAQAIGLGDFYPRHLRRCLSLLGHLDQATEAGQWRVVSPTLIPSVSDPDCWFLCGRRTQRWLERLGRLVNVRVIPQNEAPSRVEVRGIDAGAGALPVEGGTVHIDAGARHLAELLPANLTEYKARLTEVPRVIPAFLRFEYWDGRTFAEPPERVYEEDAGVYHGRPGTYRVTRLQDEDGPGLILFLEKSGRHRWLQGDWYGLRFLALCHDIAERGERPIARWESAGGQLAVPVEHRWPALYERVLVLATGALPERSADGQWLIYRGIPSDLRDLLVSKLGIDMVPEVIHEQ
jgi:hypothetical protein